MFNLVLNITEEIFSCFLFSVLLNCSCSLDRFFFQVVLTMTELFNWLRGNLFLRYYVLKIFSI